MKVPQNWSTLAAAALKVQKNAYAPYSKFQVGCAIEDENGKIHTGCNVENACYSESICAERAAILKMVSEGGKQARRVALVTASEEVCFPCGGCLQVLQEFGLPKVLSMDGSGEHFEEVGLEVLMPRRFSKTQLDNK